MNVRTVVLAGLGLLVTGLGLAVWVTPSLARTAGLLSLVEPFQSPYVLAGGIAGISAMVALVTGMTTVLSPAESVPMPAVEGFTATESPGDEFEPALAELAGRHGRAARPTDHRELIESRLREDAIRTVGRVDDCDVETARKRVDDGDWTEDRYAAAFVAESVPGPRWWQLLRDRVVRADAFERSALRTAEAIADYGSRTTESSRGAGREGEGDS